MTPSEHDWITLHRLKFPVSISAQDQNFENLANPKYWRFCPELSLGAEGLPLWDSDTWCGLAVHNTQAEAEAVFNAPEDYLPCLSAAAEQWHALAIPVTHRGSVNFGDQVEENSAIRAVSEDPKGPLMVLTTAGYVARDDDANIPRIKHFMKGVEEVIDFFGEQDGNLRRGVFSGGFDQKEGFTVSLWRDDDAMMKTAYWQGVHRKLMDESRDGAMFDRSSFTRARIISSSGDWEGDPLPLMS